MKSKLLRPILTASIAAGLLGGAGMTAASAAPPMITNAASPVYAPDSPIAAPAATATNTKSLITVNQNGTGAQSAVNCGPSSVVIALKSVGVNPSGYSTSKKTAVLKVRAKIGHKRATDLAELEKVIKSYNVKYKRVKYNAGITEAAKGKTVILHTNLYGGHYVVAKGQNSKGQIRISDPAGGKIYYKTVAQVKSMKRSYDRASVIG